MSHWDNSLGLATRHDKARRRAAKLRREADKLDALADDCQKRFDENMAEATARIEASRVHRRQIAKGSV